ncbi:hypothetical protein OSB04_007078 [Centaurea solstitialis]|uniref:Integrase catalytic domain-containing protein n=1 Tax=Centaurea solstitialis TaxID=347529 RepID=A0AA38TRV0_9ASTR|nr:hypothetical protein OSB04_007078 [Centaurea solstitialis]
MTLKPYRMSKSVVTFHTPEESLRLINSKWKLTGQNFPVWKMHLDNVLDAQAKRYVIEKPISRPKCNSPEKDFAEYFKYMADESDVMSILAFSTSPEFTANLRVKYCHEVVKNIENQVGFYKKSGKYLIMKEIYYLKLEKGQSVKEHLLEMRKLFKSLSRMGYKMVQEELVHLMWLSLTDEIRTTVSAYIGEPKRDVAKLHGEILASLEPKPAAAVELMDTDWIHELGDLSCPECGSQDICEHSMNINQIEIGLPDAPGIFMIDCLITSYESWVIDTGSGNHICNHFQGFTRRETLRKDRSNLRVGEGTPLIAEAVGSYSLSLPSGLVLELENCYYVPKMIKNVLSFDLLVDQGFYYKYDYKMLFVFKNNIFYFKATPVNGLYTVNLQDNNNEIYNISKRSKDIEDQTYLWHCRLGHINKKRVELLLKGGFLGTFDFKPFDNCESCLSGKMTKEPFNKDNERASDLLEIVHTDVCGPFSHKARGAYRYFITFIDDFSRYGYVYLMRHKSESFEKFREYQNKVQNQLDRKIKFLRSDRGGEYLSQEFGNHLIECGIVSQLTPPYTPQMNGVSERRNRTLLDMVRSMMCHSTLPMSFWGHALETATHILNRAPTKSVEKTPYKLWKGKKPKMSFLKIWGCEVYVKRPTSEKLKPKSDKCFFVGYPKTTVGYYFYNPEENKFLSSGNTREDVDLQVVDEENTTPIVEPEIQHENVEPQSESIEEVQTQDLRRSNRVRQKPDRYLGFLVSQDSRDLNEPTSYGEAMSGSESEQWQEAMKAEMQSMYDNQVWELTDLPQHCRAVGRKWVFKKKTDMDGNVHTFKARLVAKGFTQTHGIDYDETFSPVAMLKSIRILMAISAYFNYEIWQMDVKTAFLNGKLTEDVYMEQPEGFEDPKCNNREFKFTSLMEREVRREASLKGSEKAQSRELSDPSKNCPRMFPWEPVNVKETSLCKDDGVYDRLLRLMLENYSKSGEVRREASLKGSEKAQKNATLKRTLKRTKWDITSTTLKRTKFLLLEMEKFLEEKFLSSGNTREDVDLQVVDEENTTPIVEPEIQHENVEPQSELIEEVQTQDLRRSNRVRQEPDRYLGFLVSQDSGDLNEPTSYGEAMSGSESEQWQEAMKAEMQSMYDNQVWELTDLPQHCRAVGRKWVFKKKTDMDGNVHTFKARLVAKGFTQTHGIDYDETFSPVAMLKSIRILMAISAYFNYEIWQMDVKTAFLNGKLTEDVYMEQPEGFEDPKNPNKVCKLLKSIYGLKQASRSWNLHFDERIKEFGFAKSEFKPCVYTKFTGSIVTFLVFYVDDILLIGNDVPTLQSVKSWLSKCFQMKDLREAAYILGIKIYRNRSKRLIGLSQSTYIDKILKKFRMDESKKGFIPMQHGIVLSKTQCPVSSQDQDKMKSVPYASAIGSIMYAMLCTRPDVAYSVSVTSKYQQNPGEPHWVAVKNILKYLRRTKDMFLVFGGSEDEISVIGYSDASFQTDRDDFRSQSGYVFTLNGGAISWKSSKQDTIADSTTEAEYIAASDAAKEAVWLRNFLSDLRVVASVSRPIDIFCDNSGAVAQAKEPRGHHKSRHVLRKYHLIREIIGRGDVRICKIPTEDNVADPLTKPLARVKHEVHANSIGMQYLDTSS